MRRFVDLALPPQCAACDNAVEVQGRLCADCFGRTQFIAAPMCVRCGVPFASAGQAGAAAVCPGCVERPPVFRSARAALRYDEQARRLILPLKHGDRVELAAILALAIGRLAKLPVQPDALIRTRQTAPLEEKGPEERAMEVAGSFAVRAARRGAITGRRVVLIDDVMTSGATGSACAAALLAAGAQAVDVLVAARVPDPRLR